MSRKRRGMDKDVEVYELMRVIAKRYGRCITGKDLSELCELIVSEGYRKADEVRKETAKAMLVDVNKLLTNATLDDIFGEDCKWYKVLAVKYGIEVDE